MYVPGIENVNVVCKCCLRGVDSQLEVLHAAEDAAEAWVRRTRLGSGTRLLRSLCLLRPSSLLLGSGRWVPRYRFSGSRGWRLVSRGRHGKIYVGHGGQTRFNSCRPDTRNNV